MPGLNSSYDLCIVEVKIYSGSVKHLSGSGGELRSAGKYNLPNLQMTEDFSSNDWGKIQYFKIGYANHTGLEYSSGSIRN